MHDHVAGGSFFNEATPQCIVDANAPWCPWGDLLARDESVVEPAVYGRRRKAKRLGGLLDAQKLARESLRGRLKAGDAPMPAQIADKPLSEPQAARRGAFLAVEDASDGGVVVMLRKAAYESDRVLIGAHGCGSRARQTDVAFGDQTTAPTQLEQGAILLAEYADADILEQGAQQLLLIP